MGTLGTGKKVGNYLICEPIGGGAMGRVWRGIDEALGRAVAIKMLRAELADHPELTERFRVEARALARLNHPNIATVFALAEEDDELYLVMEYVQGETLQARLERRGALGYDECFPIFHEALDGIQHAHDAGVVHRDIKASNLMLDEGGRARWIDFGIARLDGRKGSTRTGGLLGTPEYMAPEQVRGETGTVQSDVYSLGVLLYKLLTGRSPFSGDAEFEVMRAHVEIAPPRPSEIGVDLGDELEEVLLRALVKDPAERFPSARAFQDALVEAGAPKPKRATPPPVPESEATLYDASPPPLAPVPDAIAATVPDFDLAGLPGGVDPEAPTRIDGEAPTRIDREVPSRADREPRSGRSRLAVWLVAAVLTGGVVAALDWIATSHGSNDEPAAVAAESAPAEPEIGTASAAGEPENTDPAPAAAPAADEPAPGDDSPAPGAATIKPPGWEIVR